MSSTEFVCRDGLKRLVLPTVVFGTVWWHSPNTPNELAVLSRGNQVLHARFIFDIGSFALGRGRRAITVHLPCVSFDSAQRTLLNAVKREHVTWIGFNDRRTSSFVCSLLMGAFGGSEGAWEERA